jgi:perosamine synthetase
MFIPVSRPDVSYLEQSYVADAMRSSWISSSGHYVDKFEYLFASATGSPNCLSVSNGTVALHLALVALGIGPGDEVIVPSFTYIASVNAVKYCGATPVFVDIETDTWGIDPDQIELAITNRTRAIIAVHLYGRPCKIESIFSIAKRFDLLLVEDIAEAPFTKTLEIMSGELSDVSTYSFFGNKIISCGEGGAVTTKHLDLFTKMKQLRGQGMDPDRRYYFPVVGFNYRLTNLACAILVAQLERYNEMCVKRRELYTKYDSVLSALPEIELQVGRNKPENSPWLYSVLCGVDKRDLIASSLSELGIDSRPFFIPIHQLPMYQNNLTIGSMENTLNVSARGINLPTSSAFTEEEIDYLINSIGEVFNLAH